MVLVPLLVEVPLVAVAVLLVLREGKKQCLTACGIEPSWVGRFCSCFWFFKTPVCWCFAKKNILFTPAFVICFFCLRETKRENHTCWGGGAWKNAHTHTAPLWYPCCLLQLKPASPKATSIFSGPKPSRDPFPPAMAGSLMSV